MSNRVEFPVKITARTASTKYEGKDVKAKDVYELDKKLDELGAPRPRRFQPEKGT